jgi:hypothetical protein
LDARLATFTGAAGAQLAEQSLPLLPQQFSVRYPTRPFITLKSTA